MDYYKNVDKLFGKCYDSNAYIASGIQYDVVTDLVSEPIDVAFFKQHARIDFDTDDTLIDSYIKAARQQLEKWSQLSFGVKTMRLRALSLPDNYKLMFGRVDTVTTAGYTNVGDILKEGGNNIDIEFTTLNWIDETIKIAIARYAAGLYIFRENIVETKFSESQKRDEAKQMLQQYRNITLF